MPDRIEIRNLTAEKVEQTKQDYAGSAATIQITRQPDGLFTLSILAGDSDFPTEDAASEADTSILGGDPDFPTETPPSPPDPESE